MDVSKGRERLTQRGPINVSRGRARDAIMQCQAGSQLVKVQETGRTTGAGWSDVQALETVVEACMRTRIGLAGGV